MKSDSLIGLSVRGYFANAVHTIHVIGKDPSNDTYIGVVFIPATISVDIKAKGNIGQSIPGFGGTEVEIAYCPLVKGLRPYPYTARPDYPFQFVMIGEDEQPLIDIAAKAGSQREPGSSIFAEPQPTPAPAPALDDDDDDDQSSKPANWDQMSKEERKAWRKQRKDSSGDK